MVATKYNVTNMSAESFTGLMQNANSLMNGTLSYGFIMVIWLITMAVLSSYPNIDALKTSTYIAWLASILFSVFNVVNPSVPMALFLIVAGLASYQYLEQP